MRLKIIKAENALDGFDQLIDYDEVIKLSLDSAIETAKKIGEEAKNGKQK